MQRTQTKPVAVTKAKTQARTASVKKVPVPTKRAVPVPSKPAVKSQEESKVADDALHYCTVGPMTDYNELLEKKNLHFVG